MKIASLSENYDRNRTEIIELSKKFVIVTKDTSLIVLDSAADYVRYKIVPPQNDAELLAEYNRLVSRSHSAAANKNEDDGRISREVYDCFAEYKKWWNTPLEEFKKITMYETLEVAGGADESAAPELVLEERLFADAAPRVSATASARASSRASEPQLLAKTASGEASRSGKNPSVQIQAWSPERKYLAVLKKTPADKMYAKYLELKKEYKSSPAFYMEVSDYFAEEGYEALSLRILSNLAELNLENTDVLRALGNKLMERKNYPSAVSVFEKLIRLKGEIPQFRRDLGMAYHLNGEEQKAVDMLYSIALKKWDSRFDQVQQIALNDMNAIIASCRRENVKLDLSKIDKKLIENFDLDVRVILTWNTDDCDIDLWVTDKDGEKCYYGNRLTANGGRMSRDFTRGYGPEEFSIRTAPDGKLKIEVHYYGNHQQKVLQPVVVQAEVYTNFGRKNQQRQILTLQLDSVEGKFLVGEVEF
ncbi:MAG: YfaP family protein [Treponema sp.]|nr:YfaP family protein [Treponema sp.]